MEGQRVRCLTEGYLRGWLSFDYKQDSSIFREELILDYIQKERVYALTSIKLGVETILRATSDRRSADDIEPIFEVYRTLIGMKLPSVVSKDKIKKSNKAITKEELAEWKEFLDQVNKNK